MNAIAIILIAVGAPLLLVPLAVLVTCGVRDALNDIARDPLDAHPAISALRALMSIGAALLLAGLFVAVFA